MQTEKHVVEDFPVSSDVRNSVGLSNMNDLFHEKFSREDSCKIIYDILKLYEYIKFAFVGTFKPVLFALYLDCSLILFSFSFL